MITTVQQKTEEDFELLPDPERIVNGLRDTGYNFNTAVADIVDNSIAANATKINIEVNMDPNMQVKVYFADNGCGMDLDGLKNAMKYGSKERIEKNSLGKFGLGLKTASTAFCKLDLWAYILPKSTATPAQAKKTGSKSAVSTKRAPLCSGIFHFFLFIKAPPFTLPYSELYV